MNLSLSILRCPDRLWFIHDLPSGFTTLSSAIFPRGYCQQYLRWLSYHHSWRYYIVTRVDRASDGVPLMVSSRGISWGTEWNLAELGQGRGRRSGLHEPTTRLRHPLSYSFCGCEQNFRDDPPCVWCVSEGEILVLVAPWEMSLVAANTETTSYKCVWVVCKEVVCIAKDVDSVFLVTVTTSLTIPSC
jgi:hypothetical protein